MPKKSDEMIAFDRDIIGKAKHNFETRQLPQHLKPAVMQSGVDIFVLIFYYIFAYGYYGSFMIYALAD